MTTIRPRSTRRTSRRPVHIVATFPAGIPTAVTAPDKATVCQFVLHSLVLDRSVCAIAHGGVGVTQKALTLAVPVCVVPHGRDQFEIARRVEMAKCGARLLPKDLTISRLRDKVFHAMSMKEGAIRVAAGYASTGGAAHGADLIEQRLLGATQAVRCRVNHTTADPLSNLRDLMTLPLVLLVPGVFGRHSRTEDLAAG